MNVLAASMGIFICKQGAACRLFAGWRRARCGCMKRRETQREREWESWTGKYQVEERIVRHGVRMGMYAEERVAEICTNTSEHGNVGIEALVAGWQINLWLTNEGSIHNIFIGIFLDYDQHDQYDQYDLQFDSWANELTHEQ